MCFNQLIINRESSIQVDGGIWSSIDRDRSQSADDSWHNRLQSLSLSLLVRKLVQANYYGHRDECRASFTNTINNSTVVWTHLTHSVGLTFFPLIIPHDHHMI
jgi:hypothetical protein